jgi:hypothetical protein
MLVAGSVTSTGGLAALVTRTFGVKHAADSHPAPTPLATESTEDRHD